VGLAYADGNGVDVDYAKALEWLQPLAAEGNACGLCNLGYLYERGWAVPRSDREAMRLFRQSGELGFAGCQFNLGVMYRDGRGSLASPAEAYFWFTLADRQGMQQANTKALQMRAQLTPSELEIVERRLGAWRPQPARAEDEQP
jgi:TPR repeat protein